MTALIGRRIAAVLSGTALTAAVVASMAGAASAQPGTPPMPTQPGPRIAIDPVPGEPVVCPEIGPDGSVLITRGEGEDGPWVTIERDLPPGAVPATPLDTVPSVTAPGVPADPGIPAVTVPGVPADAVPAYPAEPGCVVASVR
ncbi:hypothetical protein ACIBCN_00375 [Nocardia sp. NPDC051052]|uniref:hypothetical protein n=1 Tax=Nocardia sp. NPDC051052 TaxID=3364322 RepID=UPI003799C7A3